jgi:hypothetical protein
MSMKTNTLSIHSAALHVERSVLTYEPETRTYQGHITITNHSRQAIQGPLELGFEDLSWSVTLLYAAGPRRDRPTLRVDLPGNALLPGGSIEVPIAFRRTSFLNIFDIRYRLRIVASGFQQEPLLAPSPSRLLRTGKSAAYLEQTFVKEDEYALKEDRPRCHAR